MVAFKEAEYRTAVAHAISGCIESPVQLAYQLWLVLNGVVLLNWAEMTNVSFTDWQVRRIALN